MDAMGVILQTPSGNIIHPGDWRYDSNPTNGEPTDFFGRINRSLFEQVNSLKKENDTLKILLAREQFEMKRMVSQPKERDRITIEKLKDFKDIFVVPQQQNTQNQEGTE